MKKVKLPDIIWYLVHMQDLMIHVFEIMLQHEVGHRVMFSY
jgi:hypothetical protein